MFFLALSALSFCGNIFKSKRTEINYKSKLVEVWLHAHTNTLRQSLLSECHGTWPLCWATCPFMEMSTGLTFNSKCRVNCPDLRGITSPCGCSMCVYNVFLYDINSAQLRHLGDTSWLRCMGCLARGQLLISVSLPRSHSLSLLWHIK